VITAVVSDLHLGAVAKRAIAAEDAARRALVERVEGVDHLVLLGDALELREAPLRYALGAAEPLFRELGQVLGGARVTIVPGNHDHQLAAPLIEASRLAGNSGRLTADSSMPAPDSGPVGRLAEWLGDAEVALAYPGTWVRDDVYATHGHYLDCHNTVPTLECLAVAVSERVVGGLPDGRRIPDDYEAALAPVYSLSFSLAQAIRGAARPVGSGASVAVWRQAAPSNGRRTLAGRALAGIVIPGVVGALNRAGLGPFRTDLSGHELRRAALRGLAESLDRLDVEPAYALFGHTHRSGPWPDDDEAEWSLAGGGRLVNTGSWVWEQLFIGERGSRSPYWPGVCAIVEDEGPPRLERLLDSVPAAC
jgi:hypothetical protein